MTAKVYVGTYAKYNNGSIQGAWIDLEGHDNDSFYGACAELHADEIEPEYMFQDFESFPASFYNECLIDERIWQFIELDGDNRERLVAFLECFGDCAGDVFEATENAYYGNYESDYDFAVELLESTGDMQSIPEHLQNYFDYDKYARDVMQDFSSYNNYYFASNW